MLSLGIGLTGLAAPREWHVHEMLFGFLPAVITGFVLTAVPNWTDRPAIHGRELARLFGLWFAGCAGVGGAVGAAGFCSHRRYGLSCGVGRNCLARDCRGKSWDHAPIGVLLSLYAVTNLLFHVFALNDLATDLPERLALGLDMTLLAFIGGRVTPNFTREFLVQSRRPEKPARFTHLDLGAIGLVAFASTVWHILARSRGRRASDPRRSGQSRSPLAVVRLVHMAGAARVCFALGLWVACSGARPARMCRAGRRPAERRCGACPDHGGGGRHDLGHYDSCEFGHTGRQRYADAATIAMYVLVTCGAILRVFGRVPVCRPVSYSVLPRSVGVARISSSRWSMGPTWCAPIWKNRQTANVERVRNADPMGRSVPAVLVESESPRFPTPTPDDNNTHQQGAVS